MHGAAVARPAAALSPERRSRGFRAAARALDGAGHPGAGVCAAGSEQSRRLRLHQPREALVSGSARLPDDRPAESGQHLSRWAGGELRCDDDARAAPGAPRRTLGAAVRRDRRHAEAAVADRLRRRLARPVSEDALRQGPHPHAGSAQDQRLVAVHGAGRGRLAPSVRRLAERLDARAVARARRLRAAVLRHADPGAADLRAHARDAQVGAARAAG